MTCDLSDFKQNPLKTAFKGSPEFVSKFIDRPSEGQCPGDSPVEIGAKPGTPLGRAAVARPSLIVGRANLGFSVP
jgi:hypothetical protein